MMKVYIVLVKGTTEIEAICFDESIALDFNAQYFEYHTLEVNPHADFILFGEGETSMVSVKRLVN